MTVINKTTKSSFSFDLTADMIGTNSIYIRKGYLHGTLFLSQHGRGAEGAGDICRIDESEIEVNENLFDRLRIFAEKNNRQGANFVLWYIEIQTIKLFTN